MKSHSKIRIPRDPERVHRRMGLFYIGERFQMNGKKTPHDSHGLMNEYGEMEYRSIASWIEGDILRIWRECFTRGGSSRLQLCSNAWGLLTQGMEERYPQEYARYIERRNRRGEKGGATDEKS